MAEQLPGFVPRQSVVHRSIQVIGDLSNLAGRDESADRDKTAIPWSEARSQPEIPEQHVSRIVDKAWRDVAELLSNTRCPLRLRSLIEG